MSTKPTDAPRPKQETSADTVERLLGVIRGQFCGDMETREWCTHVPFLRKNVVLWPAHFVFNVKRFTLPDARYEAIMRDVFKGVKMHGTSEPIRYWPGYLMKCVQDHFKHHWEEYYQEAKSTRSIAETMLVTTGKVTAEPKGVEAMAIAYTVLAGRKRQSKIAKGGKQLDLLDA